MVKPNSSTSGRALRWMPFVASAMLLAVACQPPPPAATDSEKAQPGQPVSAPVGEEAGVNVPALAAKMAGPARQQDIVTLPTPEMQEAPAAPTAAEAAATPAAAEATAAPQAGEAEATPKAEEATTVAPATEQPAPAPTSLPTATPAAAVAPVEEPCPPPSAAGQDARTPLPPAPLWNPPGTPRVGLQAGHWQVEQVPPELQGLGLGTSGGGKREPEVTLDLAQRAAAMLEAAGVTVDILPATVPPRYRAHAFLSIHTDGSTSEQARGYKLARPAISSIPDIDDRFVALLHKAYGVATELPTDDNNITPSMRHYYAFNSRRFCHAVAPGVPQAILETGFLTSAADRQLLLGKPERAARGIADGVLEFLKTLD